MSTAAAATTNTQTQSKFAGKTVLLTGSSSGLGRSLAHQLAHCKASTLILSGRNEQSIQGVAQECRDIFQDIDIHVIACDLADRMQVQELAKQALEVTYGRIDILINNGGVSSRSTFLDTALEIDERILQINFLSGAALAKALVPGMVDRHHGTILWISSVQGLIGLPHRTSYAASKHAVQGYCESLRAEVATSGIAVHVASPGYIRTNLSRAALQGDGTAYARSDKTTENGADPNDVAVDILQSVARGKADFVTAASMSAKAAIWLRFWAPGFLDKMLVRRYQKSMKEG